MQVSATTPTGSLTDASQSFDVLTSDGKVDDTGDRADPEPTRRHPGADDDHDAAGAGHDGLTSSSNGTGAATSSCS